jgi:hypothetical protein
MMLLEWVPEGLNTGALSGAKASSSRTRDTNALKFEPKVYVSVVIDIGYTTLSYNFDCTLCEPNRP